MSPLMEPVMKSIALCLVLTIAPRMAVYGTRVSPESAIVIAAGCVYLVSVIVARRASWTRGGRVAMMPGESRRA